MTKIKKGDQVRINLGKDSGKTGTVEFVLAKQQRVFVGGANLYKRHVKGRSGIEGGIIDIPKSIQISNVTLVCPNCQKPARVGFKVTGKEKVRICKSCTKEIK